MPFYFVGAPSWTQARYTMRINWFTGWVRHCRGCERRRSALSRRSSMRGRWPTARTISTCLRCQVSASSIIRLLDLSMANLTTRKFSSKWMIAWKSARKCHHSSVKCKKLFRVSSRAWWTTERRKVSKRVSAHDKGSEIKQIKKKRARKSLSRLC